MKAIITTNSAGNGISCFVAFETAGVLTLEAGPLRQPFGCSIGGVREWLRVLRVPLSGIGCNGIVGVIGWPYVPPPVGLFSC
jgi:hypothetical protein